MPARAVDRGWWGGTKIGGCGSWRPRRDQPRVQRPGEVSRRRV